VLQIPEWHPVGDQYVAYTRPQENGGHADVRWLELTGEPGRGRWTWWLVPPG